jgi:hypothetical protein
MHETLKIDFILNTFNINPNFFFHYLNAFKTILKMIIFVFVLPKLADLVRLVFKSSQLIHFFSLNYIIILYDIYN